MSTRTSTACLSPLADFERTAYELCAVKEHGNRKKNNCWVLTAVSRGKVLVAASIKTNLTFLLLEGRKLRHCNLFGERYGYF